MTWAGTVVPPPSAASAVMVSVTSMSRSVALSRKPSPSPRRRTFERIGMVLRRSTTRWTCPSDRRRAARSTVTFIGPNSSLALLGNGALQASCAGAGRQIGEAAPGTQGRSPAVNNGRALRPFCLRRCRLFLEHALQELDLVVQRRVLAEALLDLPNRVQDGRVIAPAEAAADLGQRA